MKNKSNIRTSKILFKPLINGLIGSKILVPIDTVVTHSKSVPYLFYAQHRDTKSFEEIIKLWEQEEQKTIS